ncbi:hypothetical protein D4R51_01980 [bacterium]|nr:MAG: hypothetical protein D4R51_01980 [bacterium]
MARRRISEENIRSIQKSKRSYYITLPIEYVRDLGWGEGRQVLVEKIGRKLTIKIIPPKK